MSDLKIESGKIYRHMDGRLVAAGSVQEITDPYLRLEWDLQQRCLSHGYHKIPSSEEILRHIADLEKQDVDVDNLETLYLMVHHFEVRSNSNFQKMEVGKRYRMHWDDGGICDYTVTGINEDHIAILWDNGADTRFQYTSGMHEKSKPL